MKITFPSFAKLPTFPPEIRHRLQELEGVLHRADAMVQTLHYARAGTLLDKALAGAGILGQALDAILPYRSPEDELVELGYVEIETGLGSLLCEQLTYTAAVREEVAIGESDRVVYWSLPDRPRVVAALFERAKMTSGPYVLGGDVNALAEVIQQAVWRTHSSLMLTASAGVSGGPGSSSGTRYLLEPMKAPATYEGEPGLDWWVTRMRRHQKPHALLIIGPTGSGKSTLGRLLAQEVLGSTARTLKIASSVVDTVPQADLLHLATFDSCEGQGGREVRIQDGTETERCWRCNGCGYQVLATGLLLVHEGVVVLPGYDVAARALWQRLKGWNPGFEGENVLWVARQCAAADLGRVVALDREGKNVVFEKAVPYAG